MNLEQYIETLSEEEKQAHKDLIDECRWNLEQTTKCVEMIVESSKSCIQNTGKARIRGGKIEFLSVAG